jgi:hypothetical protein
MYSPIRKDYMRKELSAKEIIDQEVAYYTNLHPVYKRLFGNSFITTTIKFCEGVTYHHPSKAKLICDFLYGLSLFPIYIETRDDYHAHQIELLMKPIFLLANKIVPMAEYRMQLIATEVTGNVLQQIGDTTIPITVDEILAHIGRTNSIPMNRTDIVELERNLLNYNRIRYKQDLPSTDGRISGEASNKDLFPDYLIHPDQEKLAQELKNTFRIERGKGFRIMVEILINKGAFRSYGNGGQAGIYRAIKEYWGRDVGSYNGMFVSFHPDPLYRHKKDFDSMEKRINIILKKINND